MVFSLFVDVVILEEGFGINNMLIVELLVLVSGGEVGVKYVLGNGSNERSCGNYWRG